MAEGQHLGLASLPSLYILSLEAAFGAVIPLEKLPAAPLIAPALQMVPLRWEPEAAMEIVRCQAAPSPDLDPFSPAAALGAVIPLEQPPMAPLMAPSLPAAPLRWEHGEAMELAPDQSPAAASLPSLYIFSPAAALGAVVILEQLPVEPLIAPALPVAPLRCEPGAAMEIVPYRAPPASCPALDPLPPSAVLGADILHEHLLAAPLLAPAFSLAPILLGHGVAVEIIVCQAPATPSPALYPFSPAPALGAVTPLKQLPVAPLMASALAVEPCLWQPDARGAIVPLDAVDTLDVVDWSSVAKTFAVMDLDESDKMTMPKPGWGHEIKAYEDRLSVEACPSERVASIGSRSRR